MLCPKCKNKHFVAEEGERVSVRNLGGREKFATVIYRRYTCRSCAHRFKTSETFEGVVPIAGNAACEGFNHNGNVRIDVCHNCRNKNFRATHSFKNPLCRIITIEKNDNVNYRIYLCIQCGFTFRTKERYESDIEVRVQVDLFK